MWLCYIIPNFQNVVFLQVSTVWVAPTPEMPLLLHNIIPFIMAAPNHHGSMWWSPHTLKCKKNSATVPCLCSWPMDLSMAWYLSFICSELFHSFIYAFIHNVGSHHIQPRLHHPQLPESPISTKIFLKCHSHCIIRICTFACPVLTYAWAQWGGRGRGTHQCQSQCMPHLALWAPLLNNSDLLNDLFMHRSSDTITFSCLSATESSESNRPRIRPEHCLTFSDTEFIPDWNICVNVAIFARDEHLHSEWNQIRRDGLHRGRDESMSIVLKHFWH